MCFNTNEEGCRDSEAHKEKDGRNKPVQDEEPVRMEKLKVCLQ